MAFSIFGIEFAPFSIPVKRRLQTLAVAWFVSQFIILCFLQVAFLVYLIFTPYYYLPLLYLVWYIYDFKTCERGGRRCHWLRNSPIFKYFADYFPVKLVKTVDLPSDRNYIFASHPHGIFSFSHFVNYCTEGTNFSKTFPGLLPHMITLKYQFMLPLHRDLFSASGLFSSIDRCIVFVVTYCSSRCVFGLARKHRLSAEQEGHRKCCQHHYRWRTRSAQDFSQHFLVGFEEAQRILSSGVEARVSGVIRFSLPGNHSFHPITEPLLCRSSRSARTIRTTPCTTRSRPSTDSKRLCSICSAVLSRSSSAVASSSIRSAWCPTASPSPLSVSSVLVFTLVSKV